jgi:hypothetical protein
MSTHSCIKFLIVVFLQLLVMARPNTATAQPDPNFQSRVDQFTSPPPIPASVFQPIIRAVAARAIRSRRAMQRIRSRKPSKMRSMTKTLPTAPKRKAVPLNAEADDIVHHETEFSG